jgi:hypothetical protein
MPPKCLNIISQKLSIYWYFVTVSKTKTILIYHIDELSFTSFTLFIAMSIVIVNEYFLWKSNYYFVYIFLLLQHITAHSVQLSSVVKHLIGSKSIIKTFKHLFDIPIKRINKKKTDF